MHKVANSDSAVRETLPAIIEELRSRATILSHRYHHIDVFELLRRHLRSCLAKPGAEGGRAVQTPAAMCFCTSKLQQGEMSSADQEATWGSEELVAAALSFVSHMMACHPKLVKQMRSEAGKGSLAMLEHFVSETMRLYPPVLYHAAIAQSQVRLRCVAGEVSVPAQGVVAVSHAALNRSESAWGRDAALFRPGRFKENRRKGVPSVAGVGQLLVIVTGIMKELLSQFSFTLPGGATSGEADEVKGAMPVDRLIPDPWAPLFVLSTRPRGGQGDESPAAVDSDRSSMHADIAAHSDSDDECPLLVPGHQAAY